MKEKIRKINPRYTSSVVAIIIVIPVFIAIILGGFGGRVFGSLVLAIAAVYTAYEFIRHLPIHKLSKIITPFLVLAVFMLDKEFVLFEIVKNGSKNYYYLSNMFSIYGICIPIIMLTLSLLDPVTRKEGDLVKTFMYLVFIVVTAGMFYRMLFSMTVINYLFILLLIPVGIISDTFAYAGGMMLGKRFPKKMAPKVSPKKTWVGFIVGYTFAIIYVILFLKFTNILDHVEVRSHAKYVVIFILSVILLPLISPIGDLIFSSFKRDIGIKDYGKIMPGHGGVLDRIDSWIAIFIIFGMIYQLIML
ncbi:phosphatidate cytidylyltransferase [Mycoplasma marinum]|uniref:Phosphatidate cytidylyltransferase n=1 Tax=Mycoplasma marinum TaxID=1937190 RepID=A0A4R0XT28_9MOLU|nr:phosphatidate cytidylyltransferase [Mycoplasma marinum]TCG10769.1 hypothetical protein C4B24_04015 [Mycoplasma marinum]